MKTQGTPKTLIEAIDHAFNELDEMRFDGPYSRCRDDLMKQYIKDFQAQIFGAFMLKATDSEAQLLRELWERLYSAE